MQIGQLSTLTGFSKDTIRWYEKIGLIELGKQDRYENNYRKYGEKTLKRLQQIKLIKGFGFTLKEIKDLLLMEHHEVLTCSSASQIFQVRLDSIEKQIRELEASRDKLLNLKATCMGDCVERIKGD